MLSKRLSYTEDYQNQKCQKQSQIFLNIYLDLVAYTGIINGGENVFFKSEPLLAL